MHATHGGAQRDWEGFLATLDTTVAPRLVITDGDPTIAAAVRATWTATPAPGQLPRPFLARCEHHLHLNGVEAMERDLIGGWAHPMRRRLDTAFLRTEGWDELEERAAGYASTEAWLKSIATVRAQVEARHLLPDHHSTAALEPHLGKVRDFLDSRSFVLRNKRRLNLTLGLMRLHLNGLDIERNYQTLLRAHADRHGGVLARQRAGADTGAGPRTPPQHRAIASLRA